MLLGLCITCGEITLSRRSVFTRHRANQALLKLFRQQQEANAVRVYSTVCAEARRLCVAAHVNAPSKRLVEQCARYPRPPPGDLPHAHKKSRRGLGPSSGCSVRHFPL